MAYISYREGTRPIQTNDMDNERKSGDPLLHRDRQRMVADRADVLHGGCAIRIVMRLDRTMVMPRGGWCDHQGHQRQERPSGDQSMELDGHARRK